MACPTIHPLISGNKKIEDKKGPPPMQPAMHVPYPHAGKKREVFSPTAKIVMHPTLSGTISPTSVFYFWGK
jgi:hypothetical protein